MKRLLILLALIPFACRTVPPIEPTPEPSQAHIDRANQLLRRPSVIAAFDHVERSRDAILTEWRKITEINAPSGHEAERAAYVERLLRAMPSLKVTRDSVGNIIAERKGSAGEPAVYLDAHLDTVFQPGLEIETTIRDGRLYAPGVGDDTRNVEALLAMIRALDAAKIRTRGDLVFTFTVEEETTFKGVNQLIADRKEQIDHFIALDGGYESFTYAGISINWYRHHFIGPGGHTRSNTPPFSATLPLSRAIQRIYALKVPDRPPSNLNIGMLGGSEVVNAKAADAWFTVDLRSTNDEVVAKLRSQIERIVEEEARRAGMTAKTEVISESPAAFIPGHRESELVKTTEAVHLALGFHPAITPTASNHANATLRAGISAISTGTAPCRDSHALTENCDIESIYRGIKKIILLGIALAGLE